MKLIKRFINWFGYVRKYPPPSEIRSTDLLADPACKSHRVVLKIG